MFSVENNVECRCTLKNERQWISQYKQPKETRTAMESEDTTRIGSKQWLQIHITKPWISWDWVPRCLYLYIVYIFSPHQQQLCWQLLPQTSVTFKLRALLNSKTSVTFKLKALLMSWWYRKLLLYFQRMPPSLFTYICVFLSVCLSRSCLIRHPFSFPLLF